METYKKIIWGSFVVILIIIPIIIYFFFIKNKTPSPPSPLPITSDSESCTPPSLLKKITEKKEIPESAPLNIDLNNSDGMLQKLLKDYSSHKGFKKWLKNKDIIRRFVAVVDNISRGETPAPHLEFLLPPAKFMVIKRGDNLYLDPTSYKRYNSTAEILVSLDSQKLVELYRELEPLTEEAYKELGYPEKIFNETLFQAFSVLLNTPVYEGDILLEEKVITYAFKDRGLENLSAAQKHLLRMGPRNTKKIKAKLREIISDIRKKR